MSALDTLLKRCNDMDITEQLNIFDDAFLPSKAAADLAALREQVRAWKEAYFSLEFDETTGECLLSCGGDQAEGHEEDCAFILYLPEVKGGEHA